MEISIDQELLESIRAQFMEMYKASESRIDRTNEMVCKLAEAIHDIAVESKNTAHMYSTAMQSYDKHIEKLQDRCTRMQEIHAESQQINIKLAEAIAQQEKNMQAFIAGMARVNVNNYKFDSEK